MTLVTLEAAEARAQALEGAEPWESSGIPSSRLSWPGASAAQLEFMREVYERHVRNAEALGRSFVADVPASELAEVEDGKRLRSAAASALRDLLSAAREAIRATVDSGDASVTSIGIASAYRSASYQLGLWQGRFPRYYGRTEEHRRTLAGGEHGAAAVAYLARYIGARTGAPGYSLHNDARAVDLKVRYRGRTLSADGSDIADWRRSWIFFWLLGLGPVHGFFQNTAIDEPWHWEFRGIPGATEVASKQEAEAAEAGAPLESEPASAVRDALARGDLAGAVAAAIEGGERDANRLTNLVFFARHPERNGRRIERHESELAREWVRLRDTLVLPALRAPSPGRTPSPPTSPSGGAPAGETVEAFAARLGGEWSRARAGAGLPATSPEDLARWLLQDYRDTLEGARRRWERPGRAAPDITRGWMIGREQQMRFQTAPSARLPGLAGFAPPSARGDLVRSELIAGSDVAPVAPTTVAFVRELRSRHPGVRVSTYRGHGGGAWNDRGYSLDLFLGGTDDRGFYQPSSVVSFLEQLDAAARATGQEWRALYNDFTVADAVNRAAERRRVVFVGSVRKVGEEVRGLNWHGPHPLILHLHLDIAPR